MRVACIVGTGELEPGSPVDAFCCQAEGDVFLAIDRHQRISYLSSGARGAREDLLGQLVWPLLRQPDTEARLRACFEARKAARFVETCSVSGRHRELSAYPTPDGGMSVFLRDVTAQWRADQQRSSLEASEKQRAELEQQLIGIVSHDLRNPLQVIGFAAALGLKQAGADPGQRRHFDRIVASSGRALRMIDDLLDFTRIRLAKGLTVEAQPVDLHALTAQVVSDVISTCPERQVQLLTEGDGRGSWDPDRLTQAVQNLVGNALQHTTEATLVRVTTRGQQEHVLLEVHNGGPGIPVADQPDIFQPFQRGKGARSGGGRSLGLGLYITANIVRAHGGTLSLRSSDAEGTTFTVLLPRHPPLHPG